jgi:hypothetical protein
LYHAAKVPRNLGGEPRQHKKSLRKKCELTLRERQVTSIRE